MQFGSRTPCSFATKPHEVAAELQRQMRESDDALAAAADALVRSCPQRQLACAMDICRTHLALEVRSNEDLRGQLSEQRLRFQDT